MPEKQTLKSFIDNILDIKLPNSISIGCLALLITSAISILPHELNKSKELNEKIQDCKDENKQLVTELTKCGVFNEQALLEISRININEHARNGLELSLSLIYPADRDRLIRCIKGCQ